MAKIPISIVLRHKFICNDYILFANGVVLSLKTNRFLNGGVGGPGYRQIQIDKKMKSLHRLLAESFIRNPENKPYVDHIDRNKLNNDLINLRWATSSENRCNAETRITSTTGKSCIDKCSGGKKWYWRVQVRKGNNSYCECFPCEESDTVIPDHIIKFRDELKQTLHGDFAFIPDRST